MSKHSLPFLFLFLTITLSFTVLAGTLLTNESATPEPTMYTLGDIHNLIVNNQTATLGNHALSSTTVSTSATTSYSVSQIYAELANLIKRENVATGTTYLNITGDYDNPDPAYATTTIIASSLTPSDPQGNFSGYTLDDIYNLITSNSTTTPTSFDDLPDSTPANTMSSLTDIYEALIALGEEKAPMVKEGITYLGAAGSYVPDPCTTDPLTGFFAGDGSSGDPYQICNWTQLNNVRNNLSAYYILNNDLTTESAGYAGIGDSWAPIGTWGAPDVPFTGDFNGGNNIIESLEISMASTDNIGLFGHTTGNIYDLGLAYVSISGKGRVGSLVGVQSGGTITNSYASGGYVTGKWSVGGFVGSQMGGTISRCYSTGLTVSATESGTGGAGGLLGGQISGSVSDSYSTVSVSGYGDRGGFSAQSAGSISNSYSTGSVTGSKGFIGYCNGGTVTNSYWDITTSGQAVSACAGEVGTTTVAMQNQGTYVSWDFDTIWNAPSGDYPTLR